MIIHFFKNLASSNDETAIVARVEPQTGYCSIALVSYRRVLKSAKNFNLRHFSYRSSDRLQRRNAKSIQLHTFAASEPVSYRALLCPAISCPAVSCPVIWSVIFTSSIFSAPNRQSKFLALFIFYGKLNMMKVTFCQVAHVTAPNGYSPMWPNCYG